MESAILRKDRARRECSTRLRPNNKGAGAGEHAVQSGQPRTAETAQRFVLDRVVHRFPEFSAPGRPPARADQA
jgi:hypothetical protein